LEVSSDGSCWICVDFHWLLLQDKGKKATRWEIEDSIAWILGFEQRWYLLIQC
jgi:hypothetical protein